jgi:hypothetical protein
MGKQKPGARPGLVRSVGQVGLEPTKVDRPADLQSASFAARKH